MVIGERLLFKYYSMKCFTFRENIKTIINSRCRELQIYFKHISCTAKRAETRVGFPRYFLLTPMTEVCYFLYQLWYTKCGPLDNTVYRKCPMAFKGLRQSRADLFHLYYNSILYMSIYNRIERYFIRLKVNILTYIIFVSRCCSVKYSSSLTFN